MTRRAFHLLITCCFCLSAVRIVAGADAGPSQKKPPAAETIPESKGDAAVEPAADPRIESLLDKLESADATERDHAQRDLIRAGPAAVAPLDVRLRETPSPELTSRAKLIKDGITRAWRYWDPAGGKISGGFQANLLPVDDVLAFKAGSAIRLNLEIRNVSPDARQLSDIRGFDVDLGGPSVFESPFCDARIILRRVDGGEAPHEGHAIVLSTDNPRIVDFKTGGNILTPIRIDEGVSLQPGDYEVRVIYYGKSRKLVDDAFSDLETMPIRFKVTGEGEGAKPKE